MIKNPIYRKKLIEKCTYKFNEWLTVGKVPNYCKEARIVPLSKEDGEFPQIGGIRTVNILPGIFKLFEKVVLKKLKVEMKEHLPLHESQTGFTEKKSTLHNINSLANTLKEARSLAYEERKRTKVVKQREKVYVCFIDLKKAFDSVNRKKLA